ncbi:MAG: hypothetical protein KGR26_01400 [Cyanobacteria bacterium REEB65]|nr:hypothetical protein [Cyanobacteria bacterium REEB65]
MTNPKIRELVDRIVADAALRADLERNFDAALAQRGLQLQDRERDALQSVWHLLGQFSPHSGGASVLGCWGIGC